MKYPRPMRDNVLLEACLPGLTPGGVMLPDSTARREQVLRILGWGPECTGEFEVGAMAFLGAENVAVQVGKDEERLILVVPEKYVIAILEN